MRLAQVGFDDALAVFASSEQGFRCRAEFRFWHSHDDSFYAMFERGRNDVPIRIDRFPIAHAHIQALMPALRTALLADSQLRHKLFQVEFMTTQTNQNLITLIYHKPLDEAWQAAATHLALQLQQFVQSSASASAAARVKIIGRSRKQKIVLSDDYIDEQLTVDNEQLHYRQIEGGFTQPNAMINQSMLSWAKSVLREFSPQETESQGDLLELYCGNGNFTVALAPMFQHVLATEVSKASVKAAHHNFAVNQRDNIKVCRLSSEEVTEAMQGQRAFRRLKEQDIEFSDYHFSTVLVDPPRAGLDPATLALVANFERILYISCNPDTLLHNLSELTSSHHIQTAAIFDQFPYTHHIETGVLLQRKVAHVK